MDASSSSDCAAPPGVTAKDLFNDLPRVNWLNVTDRTVVGKQSAASLYGFLNPLRATAITVVGEAELEWLFAQSETALTACPALSPDETIALILCQNCKPNPALTAICKTGAIALAQCPASCDEVLMYLRSNLHRYTGLRGMRHGVFLAVMNVGVLITGTSGVGKSEVAMDLVQRGHQLVADDAVEISRTDRGALIGECPEQLKGYLEIRGLGIINILKMFGPSSVLDWYGLQLIIDLKDASNSEIRKVDRLAPSLQDEELLGVKIPCLSMLVAPGRNLSVLVEAAVRNHLLRVAGIDSSQEFIAAHDDAVNRKGESQ